MKSRRWALVSIAALVLVALGLALFRGGGGGPAEAAPTAPPAGIAPIQNPSVQHWMWNLDKHQVELNNSLILFVQRKASTANCGRLNGAVHSVEALGHNPNARVDELVHAGFDKFEQAAKACQQGDYQTAYQLVDKGLAERAPATLELDEVLEGES